MSQGDPQSAAGPGGAWRRLGAPAAVALAGLMAVGGYQFFYAKKNYAYLIERDHRVLATRARQIGEAIAGERRMLLTLSELRCRLPGGLDEALRKLREQYEVKIVEAEESKDAAGVHASCGDQEASPGSARPVFRGLLRAPDGYHLEFHYQDLRASVPIRELLEPLLASHHAFAATLLADADGTVFYQRPEGNLPSLQALLRPVSSASADPAKGAAKAAADGGDAGQAALRSLRSAGREVDVELQGRKFKLFVQPLTLPAVAPEAVKARPSGRSQPAIAGPVAGGRDGEVQELLLCGLVPADELLYGSIELSPQILGAAVAVLLLALLSWPLLKLRLLGEQRRLRLADVVMVAACSLLGVSWLTLSLLGLRQHGHLERLADGQLASFASGMAANVEEEIRRAYAQLVTLEDAAAGGMVVDATRHDVQDLHGDLLAWQPGLLWAYPFAESFTLARANGSTALRWTTDKIALAPRDESPRPHVRRVLHGDLWRLPPPRHRRSAGGSGRGAGAPAGFPPAAYLGDPFTVESLSSSISGVRLAVLAKPAAAGPDSGLAVATLSLPMLSAIRPVTPPDVEFAVIDGGGAVLFHSDPERNNVENLFVETDQDLHLRSAVLARHRAILDLRYWGKDYRAAVEPVRGPPWTIVALRQTGALEAANVEGILTALVFLLLYGGAFGAALAALALWRPGYRPEWLWPSPQRSNDYLRLLLLYVLLSVIFAAAMVLLPGGDRLVAAAGLMSLLVVVLGYLQLARRSWRPPARIAWGAGLLLLCVLLGLLLAPRGPAGQGPGALATWLPFALVLPVVIGAAFVVVARPDWWLALIRRRRVAMAWAHPTLGLLLLVLLAVLPAVAAFKAAETIQVDNFVKRGQLDLAQKLVARRARAERLYDERWGTGKRRLLELRQGVTAAAAAGGQAGSVGGGPGRAFAWDLDLYVRHFFATRIEEAEPAGEAGAGGGGPSGGKEAHGEDEPLPGLMEDLLPAYSSYAAESRELIHDRATDGGWHWDREGGALALESEALRRRLVSQPPRSWLAGTAAPGWNGANVAGTGIAAALLLSLLAGLAWFISRRVFLVDLIAPLWLGREGALPAAVGNNIFLVNRRQDWHLAAPGASFVRLHCKELEQETPGWPARRLELLRSQPGRSVVVEGFEHRILEPEFNARKLALLEDLIQDRTVVVLSTVHPQVLLARRAAVAGGAPSPAAPAEERDRWSVLLDAFTLIDEDVRPRADEASLANVTVAGWREMQQLLRRVRQGGGEADAAARNHRFESPLLAAECGDNPVLIQFGRELDPFAVGLDRRQLLEELGERAELYYRSLWASCGDDEQLVLGHLAEDGLVNLHDRKWVRRLMARGLVRREPVCRLMNETFRRFVLSPACRREVLDLEQHTGPSPWERFRRPFFVTVAAAVVFFLATQKQLLDSTLAIAGAATAALPAMGKVLDLVSGRRGSGATGN